MARRKISHEPVSCFACQNRQRSEWCVLTENELSRFDKAKSIRHYKPGEFIYHEGDLCQGIHCLEDGLVALRKYNVDGQSTLLGLANPGRTLGYRSLLSGSPHVTSAEVIKPSRVCFIDRAVIRELIDHNPALGYQFLRRASKDLGRAAVLYHQGQTLSVRDRFIHLLLVLRSKYGSLDKAGALTIELPLSRQDLAALIGTRPETLARTIRQLEDEGAAHFEGRRIRIAEPETLFAGLGLES